MLLNRIQTVTIVVSKDIRSASTRNIALIVHSRDPEDEVASAYIRIDSISVIAGDH